MSTYINLEQICTIVSNPKKRVKRVNYEEYTVNGGLLARLGGKKKEIKSGLIYKDWEYHYVIEDDRLVTLLKEEKAYIDEKDNQVYHLPHVIIRFSNDRIEMKYFSNLENMNSWILNVSSMYSTTKIILFN